MARQSILRLHKQSGLGHELQLTETGYRLETRVWGGFASFDDLMPR